jgi:hypothetical protein
LRGGDHHAFAVHADAEVAGFDEVEVFGGAGIIGIVDVGVGEQVVVGEDLGEGTEVDERALGVEDDDLAEEFVEGVGDERL